MESGVVIGGATYYVATKVAEKIREQSYDYYMATLTKRTVYIGPSIDYGTAYDRTLLGGDTFARTGSLARSLASAAGAGYRGPDNHGSSESYFDHYHPKYGSLAQFAHCFY